ncbi:hypothetical protein CMO96_00420 [Candidatus Woesebacteria bacterium]|nr:hypothetical protein [Candidatus Woesebacteria bacterium]
MAEMQNVTRPNIKIVKSLDMTLMHKSTRTINDTIKKATGIKKTAILDQIRTAEYDLDTLRTNMKRVRVNHLIDHTNGNGGVSRGYESPELFIVNHLQEIGLFPVQKVEVLTGVLTTVLKEFVETSK